MAENKLEGFEDFDNLLGDAQAETGGGASGEGDFAGELDDLLGDGGGGDESASGSEQTDSELDSFFEDLSTIDDLEVLQEDEPAPAAAAAEESVPEPDMDDDEDEDDAPVAAAAAPEPRRAKPDRKPREKKPPGVIRRWGKRLIILAVLGGIGYFVYTFFFPEGQSPWPVLEQERDKLMTMVEGQMRSKPSAPPPMAPPPPPPQAAVAPLQTPAPKAQPKPVARRPKPAPESGPWSLQVATCFFPSCLESFQSYLQAHGRSVILRDKTSQTESLEVYSISSWTEQEAAQEVSDRVNREHPLEGHAFIYREEGGYRISMGAFADLARANVVKDALMQQYRGQIVFATRVKAFPYKLQTILTGRFPSREAAETALAVLKDKEPRLGDAFVTRNR